MRAHALAVLAFAASLTAVAAAQDAQPPWPLPPADARVYDMAQFCRREGPRPSRHLPLRARRERIDGQAVLVCVMNDEDKLASCQISAEAPADIGFGNSALEMACRYSPHQSGFPLRGPWLQIHTMPDGARLIRLSTRFRMDGDASPPAVPPPANR